MAKVKGPLLSLSAQGQIGKALVSATWRGVPYMRQYVVPANPRSTAQTTTRNTFAGLDDMYKRMLSLAQAPFTTDAQGKPYTGRNRMIQVNMPAVRGDADMANFIACPGVLGGLPGLNFTAAGGGASGEIDVSIDAGQAPVDWEQPFVTFIAFPDRDPAVEMTEFVTEAQETGAGASYTPPITISHTFASLTAGTDYYVAAFLQWTRSDGTTAYGPSSSAIVTATA